MGIELRGPGCELKPICTTVSECEDRPQISWDTPCACRVTWGKFLRHSEPSFLVYDMSTASAMQDRCNN